MRLIHQCFAVLLGFAIVSRAIAAPIDAYDVVWDSPSADHHGSMPLGNGDIALNAWMTADGDLQFYISKTDAWDDYARLVKVGKVRVHFSPNPIVAGEPFHQELKLAEGCIEITAGNKAKSRLRLWVDANHPVIHVTAESAKPLETTASIELWRTNQYEDTNLQVSDVLTNQKLPDGKKPTMLIEPDTILSGQQDRIGWFHYNVKSVGPELLARIQGLTGFKQADPILHRTFGAIITAENGKRLDDKRLLSPSAKSHRFRIYVLTAQPSSPGQWLAEMDETIRRVESHSFNSRFRAHKAWWKEFWNRSWIRASSNANATPPVTSMVPVNQHPVRIGMDQGGGNKLAGELGRASLFNRALSDSEIKALAQSGHQPLGSKPNLVFSTATLGAVSGSSACDLGSGMTVEAWVKPQALSGGGARIVDKITPGGSDGFLLDTFPGNSLRFICGDRILQRENAVPADRWTHVAAVVDPVTGGCRLYVEGKRVADDSGEAVRDEAAYVSQMYHLQRFITACAGRGAYPIKFNGSLFTVPPGPTEKDSDYRRWGVYQPLHLRGFRSPAPAVPHVCRPVAAPLQVPHQTVPRPQRRLLPGVHHVLGRGVQRNLRLDPF